jgi:curli production assembly/transport component CsgG
VSGTSKNRWAAITALCVLLVMGACSSGGRVQPLDTRLPEPNLNTTTRTQYALTWLPRPEEPIPIAVYGVADETGAFKPSDSVQTLSRAVTQGATSILIKSLQDAGNRGWFTVVERENLDNLLRERQIILEMRQRYLGESPLESTALPSLFFAGIIIEGAITGYDTNLRTGGAGAAYLGIGASTQYRQDAVSIYLRAVSVKTGEVLVSVTTEQRIASFAVQGSAFRFVAFQELLEAEAGVTFNDPRHLAVRQAFEKGVYGLIIEGARAGIWSFEDSELGEAAIDHYERTYATSLSPDLVTSIPEIFFTAEQRARERKNQALAASSGRSEANHSSPQTMFSPSMMEDTPTN